MVHTSHRGQVHVHTRKPGYLVRRASSSGSRGVKAPMLSRHTRWPLLMSRSLGPWSATFLQEADTHFGCTGLCCKPQELHGWQRTG